MVLAQQMSIEKENMFPMLLRVPGFSLHKHLLEKLFLRIVSDPKPHLELSWRIPFTQISIFLSFLGPDWGLQFEQFPVTVGLCSDKKHIEHRWTDAFLVVK